MLTSKETDIALNDPVISYIENGLKATKMSYDPNNFFIKTGIRFEL